MQPWHMGLDGHQGQLCEHDRKTSDSSTHPSLPDLKVEDYKTLLGVSLLWLFISEVSFHVRY